MRISSPPALMALTALLVVLSSACNSANSNGQIYPDEASAREAIGKVVGADREACTSIAWDMDASGTVEADEYAQVYGFDGDIDSLAIVPIDPLNIYAENMDDGSDVLKAAYLCDFVYPAGYVLIESNDQIGADCDDTNADIREAAFTGYLDLDDDTYGDPATEALVCGMDGYVDNSLDCNDADPTINPGATEVCNDVDDNCDGLVDDADPGVFGGETWYPDADGDSFGVDGDTVVSCNRPDGYADSSTDCDDSSASINPGATEVCDYLDDNCNDEIDEGGLYSGVVHYDGDGDSYGGPVLTGVCGSVPPEGLWVFNSDDCDDVDSAINPDAAEICDDAIDQDCDGHDLACEDPDPDSDGDGDPDSTDCNDTNPAIKHGATEVCNSVDDNCDGLVDEGVKLTFHPDTDSDGYGNPAVITEACAAPAGYVSDNTDCNDGNGSINPGATEICEDSIDQDCNGSDLICPPDPDTGDTSEPDPDDMDGDSYMSIAAGGDDCNDSDASINPDAIDVDNDGVDNNCDGTAVDLVCLTGNGTVGSSDVFEIFGIDYTLNWWELPGSGVFGSGTVCASFALFEGHEFKVNAEVNSGEYWFIMTDEASVPDHLQTISVAGIDYSVAGADPGDDVWTSSGDLDWKLHFWTWAGISGRDMIFVVPPLPVE